MQLRCMHCYTPFTLSQEGVMAALDEVEAKGFKYYNAFCPRCGRPNMVPKPQLEREAPGWAPRTIAMRPVTSPAAAAKPASAAPKPAAKAAAKPAKAAAAKPKAAAKKAAPKTKAKKPAKKAAPKKPSKAKATKAKSMAKKKTTAKKRK
ncbi:MAG: hypothetical protein WD751_03305 [Anaerolineales bacterium]